MSAKPPTLTPGFPTPFYSTSMSDCAVVNRELRDLFLAREASGDQYREAVDTMTLKVNTFESSFDVFSWPEQPVQTLKRFCFSALGQVIAQLNGFDAERMGQLKVNSHTWFHITRRGGYMGAHNHPMASWSGVYCVDDGGADPNNPDSGVLRFHDPRNSVNMYMDVSNANWQPPWRPGPVNFRLRPGQLVIFPSFLMHEVAPYGGDGTRITVAFNSWVTGVDASETSGA